MPYQPAVLGSARLGNFRLGYESATLAKIRAARAYITIGGVFANARVRVGSVIIHDILNDAPNTCSLTIDTTAPTVGQDLRVTVNSDAPRLFFNGMLQTVDLSYEGKPTQTAWSCTAIDDMARLNERRPFGTWTNVSVTTIAQYLIATFAPGFTSTHVAAALPAVTITFDGTEAFSACLGRLATAIGGYFFVEDLDLWLFTTDPSGDPPDPLDSTPGRFLDDPPITISTDRSQLRTRQTGKGHGETVPTDIAAGETIIPLADAVMFNPLGGLAIAGTTSDGAQSQILTYTGIRLGGAGTLVGPGAAPSAAPVVTRQAGSGIENGVHKYAYTDVTAAGESLPSPLASVTHETPAAPGAVTATAVTDTSHGSSAAAPGMHWSYKITAVDSGGVESAASVASNTVTTAVYPPAPYLGQPVLIPLPTGPGMTAIRIYRNTDNGSTWSRLGDPALGTSLGYDKTPGSTFLDPWADSQITGNPTAPSATALNQSALSAIAIGAAGTTSRWIYRTAANAAQLKRLHQLADNTTTVWTDSAADATLGANAPTSDTSGLTQPLGQVTAGSTSLPTASTGPFASTGGWLLLGANAIRYTGISGNSVTGIPASGPGAILTTVTYGTQALPAPSLTGVTGLTLAMAKGTPVHVWVQRNDLSAQADLIALDAAQGRVSTGIVEGPPIVDERRGEASLIALCDATLVLFSRPLVTVTYASRDVKTRSGKPIVIDLVSPAIDTTLTLQEVTISEIDVAPGLPPKFTATASSVRFSLESLLRGLLP
jgi:hypothetical protein